MSKSPSCSIFNELPFYKVNGIKVDGIKVDGIKVDGIKVDGILNGDIIQVQ